MKKRIIALILFVAFATSMASCNNQEKKPTNSEKPTDKNQVESTDPDAIYEEGLKALDGKNYDGYDFTFFCRNSPSFIKDCYVEEETGETIDDAVYARNMAVTDKFGVNFKVVISSDNNYETDAMNTILAGDDAYDVVVPHARAAFVYALQNTMLDWRTDLPYIDLSKPWWSPDMQKSFTINGRLLTMTGDLSHGSLSDTHALYFNKNLFDELGLDYPYDMVREGKWTFDEFTKLANLAVKDLNGDGVIEPQFDRIGYLTGEWSGPTDIIYTGGQRIFSVNDEGVPELVLYNEKTVSIFDKYFKFLDSDAAYCGTNTNFYGKVTGDLFREDRTLFTTNSLGAAQSLRNMESDFGIIPLPKFTLEDEYATIVDGGCNLFCVPITASNPERTSVILEALSIYGSRDVIPAFYDVALQTKYTRDEDSSEMMDIIRATRVYDLGYLAGGELQSTGRELANLTNHDFSSFYAKNESSVLLKIEDIIEAFSK